MPFLSRARPRVCPSAGACTAFFGWTAPAVLGAALLLSAQGAAACSIGTGVAPFEPSAKAEPEFGRPTLPAPILREVRVYRATSHDGVSCSDAGSLLIELAWPEDAPVDPERVGFYFKPVRARQWAHLFDKGPVRQLNRKTPGRFSFVWIDPPAEQVPMDFELDVIAVDERSRTSKPLRIRVAQDPPRKP